MADIEFNGSSNSILKFNGVAMDELKFNGTTVWTSFIVADNIVTKTITSTTIFTPAEVDFIADGTVTKTINGSETANGTWGLPATAGISSDYNIRVDVISGSTPLVNVNGSSESTGAYFPMGGGDGVITMLDNTNGVIRVRLQRISDSAVVLDTNTTTNFTLTA